jgi:hypothetical protein
MSMSRHTRTRSLAVLGALLAPLATLGCSSGAPSVPGCTSVTRLAIVAQSVPGAAYVPCVAELPTGWRVTHFETRRGRTAFSLLSDRADGRAVDVRLAGSCDVQGATPLPPRAVGGRTYVRLRSISPQYAGAAFDVFAGGCVRYVFDFARGPHIVLMEEMLAAVELVPRRELRLRLRTQLGVELDR